MNHIKISNELERTGSVLLSLLQDQGEETYNWRPAPGKWNLLEIVCHLVDEEQYDFRARVKHTLETPDSPMLPIDPVGWVKSWKYEELDYQVKLDQFSRERNKSIKWLRALKKPDWSQVYHHPKLGNLSAASFLQNWLAHDHLHIRQIVRLLYHYEKSTSGISLNYAGKW